MPEPREHDNNLERGHILELPLGGLLSERLASEGVDPAELSEPAAAMQGVEPLAAEELVEDPGQESVSWPDAGIAILGLLADLMNMAQAASVDEPGFVSAPAGQAPTEQPQPPAEEPAAEPVVTLAAGPFEPLSDAGESVEPHELAIPGLLALLGAEDEPEELEAPGAAEPAEFNAEAAGPVAGSAIGAATIGGADAAPMDEPVAMPAPEVEAESGRAEPAFEASGDLDVLMLDEGGPEPVAEHEEEDVWQASGGQSAAVESDETEAQGLAQAVPDEAEAEAAYEAADAAAALAEAAGSLIQDVDPGFEQPKLAELANVIEQIDREIAAAPTVPAELDEAADRKYERFVVFRLGGNSYGLHMKLVREVEKAGRVTAVPGAPALLCGLINLRGEILPLIDPKPLLGLEPAGWPPTGYLVVVQAGGEEMPAALLVEELGGVALVDPASVLIPVDDADSGATAGEHFLGQADHRGRTVLLLDHRRLVTAEALLESVGG